MPKIEFQPDQACFEVEPGTEVLNLVEEKETFVSLGCRNGMCGTCVVTVEAGLKNIQIPTDEELETLASVGASPNQRLACQMKIYGNVTLA